MHLLANRKAFKKCDFSGAILLGDKSPVVVHIAKLKSDHAKMFYFACNVQEHCIRGQKLALSTGDIKFWNVCINLFLGLTSSKCFCFTNSSILTGYTKKTGYFCHPNTDMNVTSLDEAMEKCLKDPLCDMFYDICGHSRFRQCNDTAYVEKSGCGLIGNSVLYRKGIINIQY